MLNPDPIRRLDLTEVLQHPFFECAYTQIKLPEDQLEVASVEPGIRLSACVCGENHIFICEEEPIAEQASFIGC
jgi:hypothetical protein